MMPNQNLSSDHEDTLAMNALAGGDDDALTTIIKRWQKPIVSFLYRTTGEYETARDLAQEVFVRLYRNRQTYRVEHKLSSYLFMIASNLAKNHFRWKSRHPESRLETDWGGTTAGSGSAHRDPGAALEKSEEGVRLQKALLQIPAKLRIAIVLFYFEELSQPEIAKILKCSRKSVETRIYRAKQLLKACLQARDFGL